MAMNKLKIQQQIVLQMELIEALGVEFQDVKQKLIAAKKELQRLKQLLQPMSN